MRFKAKGLELGKGTLVTDLVIFLRSRDIFEIMFAFVYRDSTLTNGTSGIPKAFPKSSTQGGYCCSKGTYDIPKEIAKNK